jgi:hypothetical protein
MHINIHDIHLKYPLFFSCFNETGIFSTDFIKNTQISSFMKIGRMGAECFDADGRTDMAKVIIALRTSADATENVELLLRCHRIVLCCGVFHNTEHNAD